MYHRTSSLPLSFVATNPTAASCFAVNRRSSHRHRHTTMGSRWGLHPSPDAIVNPPTVILLYIVTDPVVKPLWQPFQVGRCCGFKGNGDLSVCQFGGLISLVFTFQKVLPTGWSKKMHHNLKYSCLSNTMQGFARWTIILSDHSSAHINFILHAYFIAWSMGGTLSSLDGQKTVLMYQQVVCIHICIAISLAWLPFTARV